MAIEFVCSNRDCRRKLKVGDELSGKKVKCPKCKTVMVVPETNEQMSKSANEQAEERADEQMSKSANEQAEKAASEQAERSAIGPMKGTAGNAAGGVRALDAFLDEKRGRAEPFEREKELAHGGMGAVILARDKAIQRELAVKVMRPQIADSEEHRLRFLEEAQVTGQLEHPNIVPIHDLGKDAEGNLYFTMKLVKGRSLGEILKETKDQRPKTKDPEKTADRGRKTNDPEDANVQHPTSTVQRSEQPSPSSAAEPNAPSLQHSVTPAALPDLLSVFLKICDGMAFAHSRGVIHRDLKPDNIMVGEFGEVQIMDWGLAKVLGQDQRPDERSSSNATLRRTESEGRSQGAGGRSQEANEDGSIVAASCQLAGSEEEGETCNETRGSSTQHPAPRNRLRHPQSRNRQERQD